VVGMSFLVLPVSSSSWTGFGKVLTRVGRLVFAQEVKRVILVFVVSDVTITKISTAVLLRESVTYPFPATKRTSLPSAKNGMSIPLIISLILAGLEQR
jgi:hypothetical protein